MIFTSSQLYDIHITVCRQNKISSLPDDLYRLTFLETLSISSNLLQELPECLSNMTRYASPLPLLYYIMPIHIHDCVHFTNSLKHVYANCNLIKSIPEDLLLPSSLQVLNLSNNQLTSLPSLWLQLYGKYDASTGKLIESTVKDSKGKQGLAITLLGNAIGVDEEDRYRETKSD